MNSQILAQPIIPPPPHHNLLAHAAVRVAREATRIDLRPGQRARLMFQAANLAQLELEAGHRHITGVAMWSEPTPFGAFNYLAVGFSDWLPVMVAANGMTADLIRHNPNSTAQMRDAALCQDYLVLGVLG